MTMTEYEELLKDTRLFYRLPKRLFEDPAFGEMSIDAKMLYMILLDRRCLSEINGSDWRDDHGCVFIYFTIEEIMRLMNCGNKKVNELLKELEKYDLVQRKHRGPGKPNRICVYDLLSPYNPNWKPGVKKLWKEMRNMLNTDFGCSNANGITLIHEITERPAKVPTMVPLAYGILCELKKTMKEAVPVKEMKDSPAVSIADKYSLSIQEAAEYYRIGEKRLRSIISEHYNEPLFSK